MQLAEKLEYMEKGAESRIAMKISHIAKKKAAKRRKTNRKYGKIAGLAGTDKQLQGDGESAEEEASNVENGDHDNEQHQSEGGTRDQA